MGSKEVTDLKYSSDEDDEDSDEDWDIAGITLPEKGLEPAEMDSILLQVPSMNEFQRIIEDAETYTDSDGEEPDSTIPLKMEVEHSINVVQKESHQETEGAKHSTDKDPEDEELSPTIHPLKRKRPREALQPASEPAHASVDPTSWQKRVSAANMKAFTEREATRQLELQQVAEDENLSSAEKWQKRWALLEEADKDQHEVFGTWQWKEQKRKTSINEDVKFTGHFKLSAETMECSSELDFLQLFLTNSVVDSLVRETNRYAHQVEGRNLNFEPVTPSELKAFIGLTLAFGLNPRPTIREYWLTSEIFCMPFYSRVMARNRYSQISRFLHVSDNKTMATDGFGRPLDKLFKIRPLLDSLINSFQAHFKPSKELTVDEQLLGTKCHVSFLQRMRAKPLWGIKVWSLCDAATNYLLNFQVYTGASVHREKGLPFRIVNNLMTPYLGKGHHLYMDNFYTSPTLLWHLLANNTLAAGTVRQMCENLPSRVQAEKIPIEPGQAIFLTSHDMTLCRWKERRDVLCLSTIHGNSFKNVVCRLDGNYGTETVKKPALVCDYNRNMGAVDMVDQHLTYCTMKRRTMKWWKHLFWRLIDLAIVNAYILFKLVHKDATSVTHKKFREKLVLALCNPHITERSAIAHGPRDNTGRLAQYHEVTPVGLPTMRLCIVCRKRTGGSCKSCGESIRIHRDPCLGIYHSFADYKSEYKRRFPD